MAVQAYMPHRITQMFGDDHNGSFFSPLSDQQRILNPMVRPVALIPQSAVNIAHVLGARKRVRESTDCPRQQKSRASPSLNGLRLVFDDEGLNTSTTISARPDAHPTFLSKLYEEVSAQMLQQQQELDQFLTAQKEQFRQDLEERRHRHSRELLATIEDGIAKRLKESEMKLEKANQRKLELEERVKKLTVEARLWQSKAKSNEAMVAALRSNLQLAQSREGSGDSEADDAASANYGDMGMMGHSLAVRGSRDMKKDVLRACRVCKINEVCILLLPCRHLCLCKNCEGSVDICPLCNCPKNASVEVYMS